MSIWPILTKIGFNESISKYMTKKNLSQCIMWLSYLSKSSYFSFQFLFKNSSIDEMSNGDKYELQKLLKFNDRSNVLKVGRAIRKADGQMVAEALHSSIDVQTLREQVSYREHKGSKTKLGVFSLSFSHIHIMCLSTKVERKVKIIYLIANHFSKSG